MRGRNRIRKFLSLSVGDKIRLLTAAVILLFVYVAINIVPFARVRHLLLMITGAIRRVVPGAPSPSQVVWAIEAADTNLPGSRTCLVRSLSAETLLRVYGYIPEHRIGVDKESEGEIKAHSWLEHEDDVIIGDVEHLSRYNVLPSLDYEDEL